MRAVTSFQQVQIVLNQLLNWQNQLKTQNWDLHQLRITDAAPAVDQNDYVILAQLPTSQPSSQATVSTVTVVFSSTGTVTIGQTSAPYIVGRNRAGSTPWEVHLAAQTPPSGGPLTANVQLTQNGSDHGTNLLVTDISLPDTAMPNVPVIASNFVSPTPAFPYLGAIAPIITLSNGAALVTVSLVIKLVPITISF